MIVYLLTIFVNMRVVIQRVSKASVSIGDRVTASIGRGLMVFVGIKKPIQLKILTGLVTRSFISGFLTITTGS